MAKQQAKPVKQGTLHPTPTIEGTAKGQGDKNKDQP